MREYGRRRPGERFIRTAVEGEQVTDDAVQSAKIVTVDDYKDASELTITDMQPKFDKLPVEEEPEPEEEPEVDTETEEEPEDEDE